MNIQRKKNSLNVNLINCLLFFHIIEKSEKSNVESNRIPI